MTSFFLSWLVLRTGTGAAARLFAGKPLDCLAPIIWGSTTIAAVNIKAAMATISHRFWAFIYYSPIL